MAVERLHPITEKPKEKPKKRGRPPKSDDQHFASKRVKTDIKKEPEIKQPSEEATNIVSLLALAKSLQEGQNTLLQRLGVLETLVNTLSSNQERDAQKQDVLLPGVKAIREKVDALPEFPLGNLLKGYTTPNRTTTATPNWAASATTMPSPHSGVQGSQAQAAPITGDILSQAAQVLKPPTSAGTPNPHNQPVGSHQFLTVPIPQRGWPVARPTYKGNTRTGYYQGN